MLIFLSATLFNLKSVLNDSVELFQLPWACCWYIFLILSLSTFCVSEHTVCLLYTEQALFSSQTGFDLFNLFALNAVTQVTEFTFMILLLLFSVAHNFFY